MSNEHRKVITNSVLPSPSDVLEGLNPSLDPSLMSINSLDSTMESQPPIALLPLPSEFRDEPYSDRQTSILRVRNEPETVKYLSRLNLILNVDNEGSTARDHVCAFILILFNLQILLTSTYQS